MGWIEHYGTGIRRVRKMFLDYGLTEPKYETLSGGMAVTVFGLKFENNQVAGQVAGQVVEKIAKLLNVIDNQLLSVKEMMKSVSLSGRDNFLREYLNLAIEQDFVTMKYPQSPNHPKQRYYLTQKGKEIKENYKIRN